MKREFEVDHYLGFKIMNSVVERLKQEPDTTILLRGNRNYDSYVTIIMYGKNFRINTYCNRLPGDNSICISLFEIIPVYNIHKGLYCAEICSECDVLSNVNLVLEKMKKEIMIGIIET